MIEFDKKQIMTLKGHKTGIARSCGVTQQYVTAILRGTRLQNSAKAKEVAEKAEAMLKILSI